VRLLLDTHALLWSATAPDRLSSDARAAIEDGTNEVVVSVVSAWEIATKQSLGKLDLPRPAEQWLPDVIRRTGFDLLELGLAPALRVRSLPWHHRDPFDRLLVAQALEETLTLCSRDAALSAYGIAVLAA
jgi:PIN domain nuclease of toxin-antitoxin system